MMSVQLTLTLLSLALIWGASGAEWSMKYTQQEMCAVKGSTVFMNGSYTLPEHLTITKSFWVINPVKNVEPKDLSEDPGYSGRVEYLIDKQKMNFFLKLSNVTKKDEQLYCFRIITSREDQKWLGKPEITLRVTDLHVESPGEVTEGGSADLTCKTTCSLTDPTFIWYKDGRPLTTKIIQKNQLHLQTVSSEDAGGYSCAVRGSEHLNSTAQPLRVRHPPKNVSVSISPSGGIVNMTCSSDGNPPVENYTWFKEGGSSPVGSGQRYVPPQSGSYYCQAQNLHGAQRSAAVSVLIKEFPYADLHAAVGVGCVLLFFVIISFFFFLFFIRSRNKRRRSKIEEEFSMSTVYAATAPISAPCDSEEHTSEDQDVLYANVLQLRAEEHPRRTSSSGATMEENLQEVQYASVKFHSSSPARYDEDALDDPSGIYSRVK